MTATPFAIRFSEWDGDVLEGVDFMLDDDAEGAALIRRETLKLGALMTARYAERIARTGAEQPAARVNDDDPAAKNAAPPWLSDGARAVGRLLADGIDINAGCAASRGPAPEVRPAPRG